MLNLPERQPSDPNLYPVALVEKYKSRGMREELEVAVLIPGEAAIFFESHPPIKVRQTEAWGKVTAISQGLEEPEGIDVLAILNAQNGELEFLQRERPLWRPEFKFQDHTAACVYLLFSSTTGLYAAYYGFDPNAITQAEERMQRSLALRN